MDSNLPLKLFTLSSTHNLTPFSSAFAAQPMAQVNRPQGPLLNASAYRFGSAAFVLARPMYSVSEPLSQTGGGGVTLLSVLLTVGTVVRRRWHCLSEGT